MDALGWTLVYSLWQGIAIAIVLAVVLRAMRRSSAAARYVVGMTMLMLVVGGAVVTFDLLNREATPPTPRANEATPAVVRARFVAPVRMPPNAPRPPTWDERFEHALPQLVMLWACGVMLIGAYQLGGWVIVQKLRRSGALVDDEKAVAMFRDLLERLRISRPVKLVRSTLVYVPTVIGAIRPVVLLPITSLTGLTSDQLRGLLAHELAHVRRHDYFVNAIQTLIETLLFYHPAIWWMGSAIRQERENACDDLAAQVCDRVTYAGALATMEQLRQSSRLALSARGGVLLPRIRRILGIADSASAGFRARSLATICVICIAAVSMIIVTACSSTAQPTTRPATTQSSNRGEADLISSPVTPEDLMPPTGDYRIGKNDLVQVSVMDLQAPGSETVKQARVSESGVIRLPMIGEISAVGKTEAELERAVADAYEKAKISAKANVSVTVIEARGRTFSIMGAVSQPGQYAIQTNDFRLLDALVLARGADESVKQLMILRKNPSNPEAEPRKIVVDLDPLRAGDLKQNLVIRANDLIVVPPPKSEAAQAHVEIGPTAVSENVSPPVPTQPITAKDFQPEKVDYQICPGDLLSVSIYDLTGLGKETKREARVAESGTISMPLIGTVAIAGKTVPQAEKAIAKEYEDRRFIKNATLMVTLLEARGRTFSILFTRSSAGQSGQYSVSTSDFRLLDALAISRAQLADVQDIKVRRDGGDQDNRLLEIPGSALLTGDPQYNVVIRPKDTIIVDVKRASEPSAAVDPQVLKLREAVEAKTLALANASKTYGERNPARLKAQMELDLAKKSLADYSRSQAQQPPTTQQVAVASKTITFPVSKNDFNIIQEAMKSSTAAHFVRLVIGVDKMTFQGEPVTWESLRDKLKQLPERGDTALELAIGSKDVTFGQIEQARSNAMAMVREFGMKYLTEIGEHPLGSKSGDESPATQASSSAH